MTESQISNAAVPEKVRTTLAAFMEKKTPSEVTPEKVEATEDLSNGDDNEQGIQSSESEQKESQERQEEVKDADEGFYVGATDDGELNVAPTTKFKVKDAEVTLKDLFNSYETREQISRRFNDIGKKEQSIIRQAEMNKKEREELAIINEKFTEMAQLVREGNPLGAIQIALAMSEDAEKDTLEGLIKKSIQIAENFQGMSEEEQKVFLEKENVAFKERAVSRKEKKVTAAQESARAEAHYNKVLVDYKITDDELSRAYDEVAADEHFKKELEDPDLTKRINTCANWILGQRFRSTIREGIQKVDPALANDQKLTLALIEIVDTRYSSDDIADVVKAYLGKESPKQNSANGSAVASTKDVTSKVTTPNRAPTKKPETEKKESRPALSWKEMMERHS